MTNVQSLRANPSRFAALNGVTIDSARARIAVHGEGGEDAFASAARDQYEAANDGVYQAQAAIRNGDQVIARYEIERGRTAAALRGVDLGMSHIEAELLHTTARIRQGIAWFSLVGGTATLAMGNQIGVAYVTNAGLDMFAANPGGATLFMGAAALGAVALKAIDAFLDSDASRRRYFTIIAGLGLLFLLVWLVTMAIVFAPQSGAATWLLNGTSQGIPKSTLMLLGHIGADICLGYVVVAGAEKALTKGRRKVYIENPAYVALSEKLATLDAQIAEVRAQVGEAEDFLRRFEAGSRAAESDARLAVRRETLHSNDARDAAIMAARASFLNAKTKGA